MSGNICAATNSRSQSSKATTTSSTRLATPGHSLPTTKTASDPSQRDHGRRSFLRAVGMTSAFYDCRTPGQCKADGHCRKHPDTHELSPAGGIIGQLKGEGNRGYRHAKIRHSCESWRVKTVGRVSGWRLVKTNARTR